MYVMLTYDDDISPDCKEFIAGSLNNAYNNVLDIMDLIIYPYGNAKQSLLPNGMYNFTCQHGAVCKQIVTCYNKEECRANIIETCVLHYYPNVRVHFPLIRCAGLLLLCMSCDVKNSILMLVMPCPSAFNRQDLTTA